MKIVIISLLLAITVSASAQQKSGTAYMVPNAHFDSQWKWTVQTSINEYVRNTLTQNIWHLENDPNYVINIESGIKYQWMKEYYPLYYEKIKKHIATGRWHISGSSWEASDSNIPSPESFTRNIMLGQHFYQAEFGKKSNDVFLPDCFGFSYTIPTIAKHCGLIGFSTSKLKWRSNPFYGDSKMPFKFGWWKGVDGSSILAVMDGKDYYKDFSGDLSTNKEIVDLVATSFNNKAFHYYGVGDIGGSPKIESIDAVNQGIKGMGPVKIIHATSDRMFLDCIASQTTKELPVFDGELLMDVHGTGCYTAQAVMKQYNRRNEQLANAAERSSVMAHWIGAMEYPKSKLNEAWKRFLWHQFHDDLTGTSIPDAYTFSWNDELISQSQFNDILTAASASIIKNMDTRAEGQSVVVYNPLAFSRKDIVKANVPMNEEPKAIEVYKSDGTQVNAQLVAYQDGIAQIVFAADVSPVSYSIYDVRSAKNKRSEALKVTKNSLENSIYKVTLDKNGDIGSIVDKREGRELVERGKSVRLAMSQSNESFKWPAWEIHKKTIDAAYNPIVENVTISIQDNGTAKISLLVERTYGNSKFSQVISLTDGAADDRIDVAVNIDWKSENTLLKMEFPMSISNPKATYDLGIGSIARENNTTTAYEVCAQQWADITNEENSYGISILNDCKYGWDKPNDNTLRLTLLHAPKTDKRYVHQGKQDFGYHSFTYSIVGHKSNYADGGVVRAAESLNNPMFAYLTPKHEGKLGNEFSLVKTESDQIDIKAIKRSEAADAYVVRVYESAGKPLVNGQLVFNTEIVSAKELNGIEEVIGDARIDGNKLIFNANAFSPKTFSVVLKDCEHSFAANKSHCVTLPFNDNGYTSDAFLNIADFDKRGNSYSTDLLPDTLISEGVKFVFGKLGYNNVVKCKGNTISLPVDTDSKMLHLLVASTQSDIVADFDIDGVKSRHLVPYFTGMFGQWGYHRGFIKNATLAYVGSHMHNKNTGNVAYEFTYMYKISIPINSKSRVLTLPKSDKIAIFAASISSEEHGVLPANEFRNLPRQ